MPVIGEMERTINMWAFIGILSLLACVVFIILGIITKVKKKPAKNIFLIAGATFVLFIVAIIASSNSSPGGDTENAAPAAVSSSSVKADEEAAKKAEEAKKKAEAEAKAKAEEEAKKNDPVELAKESAGKHFQSATVSLNKATGDLEITAAGSDNFTKKMIKEGMWLGATQTLTDLKSVTGIQNIVFDITFPMQDKYGNEFQDVVMKISISAETRSKINYDNFLYTNLPDIADAYWEHPAFSS